MYIKQGYNNVGISRINLLNEAGYDNGHSLNALLAYRSRNAWSQCDIFRQTWDMDSCVPSTAGAYEVSNFFADDVVVLESATMRFGLSAMLEALGEDRWIVCLF